MDVVFAPNASLLRLSSKVMNAATQKGDVAAAANRLLDNLANTTSSIALREDARAAAILCPRTSLGTILRNCSVRTDKMRINICDAALGCNIKADELLLWCQVLHIELLYNSTACFIPATSSASSI
jgi:hypothetical protein